MLKPRECNDCPLAQQIPTKDGFITLGQSFTVTEGKAKFGVHFLGDHPYKAEMQEGLPFRPNGESGGLITHIIENLTVNDPEMGKARKMRRSDFNWDNVVKCRPINDELVGKSYEGGAIEHCGIHNHRSFDNPLGDYSYGGMDYQKVIVALGPTAFKYLTGLSGKKLGIEDIRGYVFRSENYRAYIVGSLHPSFIRHGNSRYTSALIYDIKKALLIADGSYGSFRSHTSFVSPEFVREGKLEALVSFYYKLRANSQLPIFYDIENPYTKREEEEDKGDEEEEQTDGKESGNEITSIQFGCDKQWAIYVPWEKPFIKVALAILALPNDKIGANVWHHDNPRLEANGARIGGVIHDLMWAWHHMQPGLWKGLQRIGSFFDVPYNWKHLALTGNVNDDDEYGCMDVIAPAYIWEKLPGKMKAHGVWESYLRYKVEYRSKVLKPAEERGFFVDSEEHGEFTNWVESEITREDSVLQNGIPNELRNLSPKRKDKSTGEYDYGYVREPRVIGELRGGYEETRSRMLERGVQSSTIIPFEQWAERKTGLSYREFTTASTQTGEYAYDSGVSNTRWCRVEPFKASSQQLIKYLKFKGYKVPKTLKEGRETTGKKELQELWEETSDELLGSVIRIRSYNKMLSNDIPNWLPDKDGVVRTTFKFDPPSWQLNSSSPNIQNASKHPKEWELFGKVASELQLIGQRFRKIVKAPKGRCVVEFDKSGFHVGMFGWLARDPLYMKWAVHMHTVFASYIVGEPIDITGDIDLDKLNYIKKKYKNIRDGQAKPTVLGNQLGLGHTKLHYMNRTYIDGQGVRQVGIESRKRAKYLQELLAHLFPKEEEYKKRIVEEAHYKSYLKTRRGAIRWFYDAKRWDWKTRSLKNSMEAEAAISHPLQGEAFGHIHSEFLDMADNSDILEEHWFANQVHDSGIFFPEIGKRDKCIEEVYKYMMKPDMVLVDPVCSPNGLVLSVDVMASCDGGNWSSYHETRNPLGMKEIKV